MKLSASMSRKLYDQLKSEKSSQSYADHHHETTKREKCRTLKSQGNHHKQANYGRESEEEEELIKYMSNLPGYLERGKKNREKVLNVGVLDWSRLEQWQYGHKYVSHGNNRSSTSSNASSSISTDGLSGQPSRGHNCFPSGQRMFHPSLQSHFMASPMQGHSEAANSSIESVGKCQNSRVGHSKIDTHGKCVRADGHLSQNHPNSRLQGCERKYVDSYIDKESNILPNDQTYAAASCTRLKIRTQDGVLGKRVETWREANIDTVVQDTPRKSKPLVLHLPRDRPQTSHCRVLDMQTSLVQKSGNYSRISFSEKPKELSHKDLNYDFSQSYPLPDELRSNHSQCKGSGPSSIDLESTKLPASTFSSPLSTCSSPLSVKMRISPSRSRKSEEKRQTIVTYSSAHESLWGVDKKVTSEKSRSSSPFRRLSISIGSTSKVSACKEDVHVPHLSSVTSRKSCSENVRGYGRPSISGNDKPGDAGQRRSSPLRRLLDPLLKPKTTKSRYSVESSQKDSVSIHKESSPKDSVSIHKKCNSANLNFSILQPAKEVDRDNRVGCSAVNTIDSSKDKKHLPSMTQALLRIDVRNGQPLFTFVVEGADRNILAATVKNLGASGKDECNCIYTFFTIREAKKKNGSWINQAGRSKGSDHIPHVVAQMKVSDSHYYNLTGQNCVDSSTVKEFVLLSVKLGQGDLQATEYQPNDELAAIVVKIPKAISFINDSQQSSYRSGSQDLVHATVVLPSGVHSLPSKGGPSSLIERWKSGGSCDCGGWDLACKLKILANENQASSKPRSSKAYFADHIDLFFQGNEQEHRPALSFAPFKHGVYSIAFDSSLSLLQAFSICIALVDCKMPNELSGSRNSLEGKSPRDTLLVQSDELKAFGKLVDYPPLSPVGRV